MNSVVLIGRLTKDPVVRDTANTKLANFTLAVNRFRSDSQDADFIRITVFGKMAANAEKYLRKGSQVAVKGFIQTGSYINSRAEKVYTTSVVGNEVQFLDNSSRSNSSAEAPEAPAEVNIEDELEAIELDLPF